MTTPILYSFRRCPYAMRARLACKYSDQEIEIREIVLRNKPAQMLAISPKGTVPVLQLAGKVIDESWDILHWATELNDPKQWRGDTLRVDQANKLVGINDTSFKASLDRYKYADRFPEYPAEYYRTEGEVFLQQLEQRLSQHLFLLDEKISLADIGIFPFVRQFAHVDIDWFRQADYPKLQAWMDGFLESELFEAIMLKRKPWVEGDQKVYF